MNYRQLMAFGEAHERPKSPEGVAQFLTETREGDLPLFFSNKPYYLFALLVPTRLLRGEYAADIAGWNMSIPSGYGYGFTYRSREEEPCLFDPLDRTGSEILNQGLAPLFLRHFDGRPSYVEPNQWLTHVLELHRAEDVGTWCRVNELGELVPVLRVAERERVSICTASLQGLDRFLLAADMSVVRLFTVNTAERPELFREPVEKQPWVDKDREIFLTCYFAASKLVQVRGFDVVRLSSDAKARALARLRGDEPREYATFIINDFKNTRVVKWSSDPKRMGNYFVESELPFETSPAFFKPEVLSQYRTDPGRFHVLPDRVECVGAWHLPYYVNEEGLVHAYLCDLALLPHAEQLRWKAFNVPPDGGIAKQAWERDFMAEWSKDYDPLLSLRQILTNFPSTDSAGRAAPVWELGKLPPERDLNFLGYVVTQARKEFNDQVMALAQILVEGFNSSHINALAEKLGCRNAELGSVKQLGKVVDAVGVGEMDRQEIIGPLVEVWAIRSKSVAHKGSGMETVDQRRTFRDLLVRCDKAMRSLGNVVTLGKLTLPS